MTTIDLRTIPASTPSLCIPRVFSNIGEARIRRIFDELNMGEIERVDIISKTTEKGEKFNRVFVHFKRWGTDGNAEKARQRLLNGQDIKIVYDDPWFWKISAYRPPAPSQPQHSSRRPQQKAPRLELDESERPERRNRSPQRDDRSRPDNRLRGPDNHPRSYRDDRQRRPDDHPRSYRDDRQRRPDDRQRPVRDDRQRPQRPENRARTPETPPPREENDERQMDAHELAQHEEIIRKNSAVAAAQLGIQSEPAVHKRGAALKNLLNRVSKKALTIETEESKAPCVRDQDIPCGCDDCIGGNPEEE
jgi:hypothetical protein